MQKSEFRIQKLSFSRYTSGRSIWRGVFIVCILNFAFCITESGAQQQPGMPGSMGFTGGIVASNVPSKIQHVTFSQRLGERLPLDARLKDESGRDVTLGDYFGRKPVVLAFVYYQCPMLCPLVMNGISSALKVVPFTAGREFDVVLISFDPRDTPEAANAKKRAHLLHWAVPETADGWHLLTGVEPEIQRIASAAGFTYEWDEETQQFAHVSGVLVATPDGRLSRYFYGVEFSPKDLRLALVDSSQGRLGSVVEELLLYCFHYDPSSGKYGAAFMNIMRLGGVLTVGLVIALIVLMRWRESRHLAERHA
jgi:protein SCO1/2